MQKEDINTPLYRDNSKNKEKPIEVVKKASEEALKTRRIVQIKPFGEKKTSDTKPTKAIFNISNKVPVTQSKPVSGDFMLKPNSSSLDFFKKGTAKSGVSGELKIDPSKASMDMFQTKKIDASNEEKPKEVEKEGEKKEEENKGSGLFGKFVENNKIGSGLFGNLVPQNASSEGQKDNKASGLFGSNNGVAGSNSFGIKTGGSSLFGTSSGLFTNRTISISKTEEKAETKKEPVQKTEPVPSTPIDPKKFDDPSKKPLFSKPLDGGLFGSLANVKTSGIFSGLGKSTGGLFSNLSKVNNKPGLFSNLPKTDGSSFFKKDLNEMEDDGEEDEEEQNKEESVDETKVEMKVQYQSDFDTLISCNVRNFKEQKSGSPPPEGGFGCGMVSLEIKKTKEGEANDGPKTITFVYRNQAKLVKHQSVLLKGLCGHRLLKSRKDGLFMSAYKNEEDNKPVKYIVKVLFNEEKDAADFVSELDKHVK
jgi:hypothetical protein